MTERAYTVKEIDALRSICGNKYLYGEYFPNFNGVSCSRSYNAAEKAATVEEMVRTFMLAGLTADAIREQCKAEDTP